MNIGIVVVTYNSAEVLGKCLDSCGDLPVVVVDNASVDGTRDLIRGRSSVFLVANSTNRGFAEAVNQGVEALDREFILVLNPDIELITPLDALAAACRPEQVGIAGGRLLDEQNRDQRGFSVRRFPTPAALIFEVLGINRIWRGNPVNRRYRCLDLDLDQGTTVDQPPGALLMFRRDVWKKLGGFDTLFGPVWFEDVDFCRRARDLGFQIQYVPQVVARHQGGHSIAKLDWACREMLWYVSLLRYASKHFRPYAHRGVSAAVMLASLLRGAANMIRWRSLRPLGVYGNILRVAARSFLSGHVVELEGWTSNPAVTGKSTATYRN